MTSYRPHQTIKRSLIGFASCFKDVHLYRYDSNDIQVADILVDLVISSKSKFYSRYNSNNGAQSIILPVIGIYCTGIEYQIERQQNNADGIEIISKENEDILEFLESPTPVRMNLEVYTVSKYMDDALQLLETISKDYKPTKIKRINLIPKYGVTYKLPITMQGFTTNFPIDLGQESSDVENYEITFNFVVDTFMFGPIQSQYPARTIKSYNAIGIKQEFGQSTGPDDAINTSDINFSLYSEALVHEFIVSGSELPVKTFRVNINSFISTYGENLALYDEDENEIEFVYEYANYKLYGCDYLVPTGESTTKTGYIVFGLSDVEAKDYKLTLKLGLQENKAFAKNILSIYEDFNRRNFNRLQISGNNVGVDDIYITDDCLKIRVAPKSISDIAKVWLKNTLSGVKLYEVGLKSFTWHASSILCGVSDEAGNYVYIKTGATSNTYELHTFISSVDSLISSFTISSLNRIGFDFNGTKWDILIDGVVKATTNHTDMRAMFVTASGTLTSYSYLKGFNK